MKRKKTKVKFDRGPLFTEVKESVQELLTKFGIKSTMSQLAMVQAVRAYIEDQPNSIRTCNAILYKLGIEEQIKDSPRKARVYALTAIDEAIKQGAAFDPITVKPIAESRLIKIENLVGREIIVASNNADDEKVKPRSKKEIATEIFLKNKDKPKEVIIAGIMKALKLEKQAAQGYLYQVKRSLTI